MQETTSDKKRKPRTDKISEEELIYCYKHYFQEVPEYALRTQIVLLKKFTERRVYNCRKSKKIKYSQNELIFVDFIEGLQYPTLKKKYNVSQRKVQTAIAEMRKVLVEGIKNDIAKGFLVYKPV